MWLFLRFCSAGQRTGSSNTTKRFLFFWWMYQVWFVGL
jgi:hypothetical protein